MTLELPVLISAVTALSGLVKETTPLLDSIRSGFAAKNDKAKQDLSQHISRIESSLTQAGELARVTESYLQTHDNIVDLLSLSRRAEQFVKDDLGSLRDRTAIGYGGGWKLVDEMFSGIDRNRDAPRRVVLDRSEWYDAKDKTQIELLLHDFTSAYDSAAAYVSSRAPESLLPQLGIMTRKLQEVDSLLRETVYGSILPALQKLGT